MESSSYFYQPNQHRDSLSCKVKDAKCLLFIFISKLQLDEHVFKKIQLNKNPSLGIGQALLMTDLFSLVGHTITLCFSFSP